MYSIRPSSNSDYRTIKKWVSNKYEYVRFAGNCVAYPFHRKDWIPKRSEADRRRIGFCKKGILIGYCEFTRIDSVNKSARLIRFIIDPLERSKGLGLVFLRQVIRSAFSDMNLNRIDLVVFEDNQKAIQLYMKTGFQKEGTMKEARFVEGEFRNLILMRLLKREYGYRNE